MSEKVSLATTTTTTTAMDTGSYLGLCSLQNRMSEVRDILIRIIDEAAATHSTDTLRTELEQKLAELRSAFDAVRGKLTFDQSFVKIVYSTTPKSREEFARFREAVHIMPELADAVEALRSISAAVAERALVFPTAPPATALCGSALLPPLASSLHPRPTLYNTEVQRMIRDSLDHFADHAHGVVRLMPMCAGNWFCGIRMRVPKVLSVTLMFEQYTCGKGFPVIGPITVTEEDSTNYLDHLMVPKAPLLREITLCAERARDFFTLTAPADAIKAFLVWFSKYDDLLFRPCKRCRRLFDSDSISQSHMLPVVRHPLTYEAFHKSCVSPGSLDDVAATLGIKAFEEPLFPEEEEEDNNNNNNEKECGGDGGKAVVKKEEEDNDGDEKLNANNDANTLRIIETNPSDIVNSGSSNSNNNSNTDYTNEPDTKKVKLEKALK